MRAAVDRALRVHGLEPFRERSPHLLSGGERQRLALAAVWVMEPDYYVLDEPTSLLDPRGRREVFRFLEGKHSERGAGFLFVTQFPDEALAFERLLVLREGLLAFDGRPSDFFGDPDACRRAGVGVPVSVALDRFLEGLDPARPA
jgi:energy-coupling factor transport system ATP-binding protein